MSTIRPECVPTKPGSATYIGKETALFLIKDAIERRSMLIHGRLDGPNHSHCAIGCFFADNPRTSLDTSLIDEVATVNDSLGPKASPKMRWRKVRSWIRWRLRVMATKK